MVYEYGLTLRRAVSASSTIDRDIIVVRSGYPSSSVALIVDVTRVPDQMSNFTESGSGNHSVGSSAAARVPTIGGELLSRVVIDEIDMVEVRERLR
jgi:hypothetical protein